MSYIHHKHAHLNNRCHYQPLPWRRTAQNTPPTLSKHYSAHNEVQEVTQKGYKGRGGATTIAPHCGDRASASTALTKRVAKAHAGGISPILANEKRLRDVWIVFTWSFLTCKRTARVPRSDAVMCGMQPTNIGWFPFTPLHSDVIAMYSIKYGSILLYGTAMHTSTRDESNANVSLSVDDIPELVQGCC